MKKSIHQQIPTRDLWEVVWKKSTIERIPHERMLKKIVDVIQSKHFRTLEVGCGSSVDSAWLSIKGASAFGIDYSLNALVNAHKHIARVNGVVQYAAGDTFSIPFAEGVFDVVFSQGLLEHFIDPIPAIIEQVRVLRKGGIICVDVPQTWSLGMLYKRWHIRKGTWFAGWETNYTLPELEQMLRLCDLQVVDSYGWLYFPSILLGFRNLHTINERHKTPFWLSSRIIRKIEYTWQWVESKRSYYSWLGCVGVIARK